MSASDDKEKRPDRKRHRGRIRRWFVRPLSWSLALVALAGLLTHWALNTATVRNRVRAEIEARLTERLERQVTIGEARFELLPLTLVLERVEVASDRPGEPPVATLKYGVIDADLLAFASRTLRLQQVRLIEPRLAVELRPEGGTNIPRWRRSERRSRVWVDIDALSIENGLIEADQRRIPVSLSAENLRGRLLGTGAKQLTGELTGESVTLTLASGTADLGNVSLTAQSAPGEVAILESRVSGPGLRFEGSGSILWRVVRRAALDVKGRVNLSVLVALGIVDPATRGTVALDGEFVWTPGDWRYEAAVSSPSFRLFDRSVTRAAGRLAVDREGALLEIEQATHSRGGLEGRVRVENLERGRLFDVSLTTRGASLQRLLESLNLPVRGLAGSVEGFLSYRANSLEARRGRGWLDLRVAPSATEIGLPVRGSAALLIADGRLTSEAIRLTSGEQTILLGADWGLEERRGRFTYDIDSRDVPQLMSLLTVLDEPPDRPQLWRPTTASGRVSGGVVVGGEAIDIETILDLEGIEAPGFRADRLTGSVFSSRAGIDLLRLELSGRQAAVLVTGGIPTPPEVGPAPPLSLSLDLVDWPVEQAPAWLGRSDPLSGRLSGALELGGSVEALQGTFSGRVDDAAYGGQPLGRLEGELRFDPERLRVDRARLLNAAGATTLAGSLGLATGEVDLRLEAPALDLSAEPLAAWHGDRLSGAASLGANLTGTLKSPSVDLELTSTDLRLGGRGLGDAGSSRLVASWRRGALEVEGSFLGLVELVGGRSDDGGKLIVRVASDNVGDLISLAGLDRLAGIDGGFEGQVVVPFVTAEGAAIVVELDRLSARYRGHEFANLEPVVVRLADDTVDIESVYMATVDGESDFFLTGTVDGAAEGALDLMVQSSLAADWFELVLPDTDLTGRVELLGTIGGLLSEPDIDGQLGIRDARALNDNLPHALEELHSVLLLYPDRIVLDDLRAAAAGGRIRAGGSIELAEDLAVAGYRFQINGAGLNIRYPEGWLLRTDGDILLTSVEGGRQLAGELSLDRAAYRRDVDFGFNQLVAGLFARQRLEVQETDELMVSTGLSLVVRGPDALLVDNNLAQLTGDIDLVVAGNLASPVVLGSVGLDAGGTLIYGDDTYDLERGLIRFVDPAKPFDPVVDLVATTRFREYDVTMNLGGSLERLQAEFSSDPPLSDLEVLALLTTGEQLEDKSLGVETASDLQASDILYGQAAGLVSERVNRLFGLDKFRIDPLTESSGTPSSARVTVGKRLSRDLFVTYSYDPSTTSNQILEVEWQVTRSLTLVLTQNGDGSFAADTRWEKSF